MIYPKKSIKFYIGTTSKAALLVTSQHKVRIRLYNFYCSSFFVRFISKLEIGETENGLGVLMQGANYRDDGFIAEI